MIADIALFLSLYLVILTAGDLYLVAIHMAHARARERDDGVARSVPSNAHPDVCMQVPLHNEPAVVAATIDCLCSVDWPDAHLEIQVLDDSSDATTAIAEERCAAWRARGRNIRVLHRPGREGFKAGALQEGLKQTQASYIAVFDADFRPGPAFLHQAMDFLLQHPDAAFVQARLEFRNRDKNWITRAQAVEIDTHFAYEQAAKDWANLPIIFNGTCGVWRRRAIEEAGGWRSCSLGEDQDLSFRAFAIDWRGRLSLKLAVAGELPESLASLRTQRQRWSTAASQVMRQRSSELLQRLPWSQRIAFRLQWLFNTTSSLVVVCLVLLVAAGIAAGSPESRPMLLLELATPLALIVAIKSFAAILAARTLGRPVDLRLMVDLLLMWVMQLILLPTAAYSFVRGRFVDDAPFERTLKKGA